ncbi:MAG: ANTAR domain-containing protein [Acidimicrobiales bacterium]
MASSGDAMRLLELFELQSEEGPCPDCYRTGEPIVNHHLGSSGGPWPRFEPRALAAGFKSVHALPMRIRDVTIGALNLIRTDQGALNEADVLAAQALTDVATIAVLHHHAAGDIQLVTEQLHHALNIRVVIEQAKGMLAERAGIDIDQAFSALRNHARAHDLRLVDIAQDVIAGSLDVNALDTATPLPRWKSGVEASASLADGDRLVVLTDGLLERNDAAAQIDVAAALKETAGLHPREVVHAFKAAVLAATNAELDDDAAVLCIDWHGTGPSARRRPPVGARQP